MYSRKKGQAGSVTPKDVKNDWVAYSKEEVEKLILKLAKQEGMTSAKLGLILRDSYGIPDVKKLTGTTISKILKEHNVAKELPEDLTNLIKRQIALLEHLKSNRHDQPAKRGLTLTESKIRRLIKYYKKSKVLPADWKYTKEQAKLIAS